MRLAGLLFPMGLNVDSIKTRIETNDITKLVILAGSLNVDSIKTRIETLPAAWRRSGWRSLNVDSIKTRIETGFKGVIMLLTVTSEC